MRTPLLVLPLAVGCAAPDTMEGFNVVEQFVDKTAAATNARFIAAIDGASTSVRLALPTLEDTDLALAIERAVDRGVDVRVVIDFDNAEAAGALALEAAGYPCRQAAESNVLRFAGETPVCVLACDSTSYFDFANNVDITVPSSAIGMTHAFVVTDRVQFVRATEAGGIEDGTRFVVEGRSEDLGDDLSWEHQQLFGGTDASTLTAFSSMAKSVTDNRWLYPTQTRVGMEVWMGPQERVIKRVIDAVYRARSNAYVLTNDFVDTNLARALDQKGADGFDVQVIVGPKFGSTRPELSRQLVESNNIAKFRIEDESVGVIPTLVLIDSKPDRSGAQPLTQAFVLSHDIAATTRYIGSGSAVEVLELSDQLLDGNLFVWRDADHGVEDVSTEVGQVFDEIAAHIAIAEEL